MIGYNADELPCWRALTPPEWEELDRKKARELRDSGRVLPWEKELYHRDGRRIPILIGAGLAANDEEPMVAFVLDLSDRKQAEADLRATNERFRQLYDNIPLMYFTLDYAGIVGSVNAHGAWELGYRPEELIGRDLLGVFHPEDRPEVEHNLHRYLEQPGGVANWEHRKVRKDGSILWVRDTLRTAEGPDGRPEVLLVGEDVTMRKQAEKKLRVHERELRRLATAVTSAEEHERRRIGRGLHDEIGQALATAALKLDQLMQLGGDGEHDRMLAEVRQLLDWSIEWTRSLTFELTSPVLYELGLAAALRDLGERAEQHGGPRFRFDGDGSPPPISDELGALLFRLARELVHNVVKHADARQLRIGLESTPREVTIRIGDDGCGFDVSDAGHGFSAEGGFGLFSVSEQVARLGGRLVLESTPGRGTQIDVIVPAESRSSTAAASRGGS